MEIFALIYDFFHGAAAAGKESYRNGMMPLLGSKLMYNCKVKHAHSMMYKLMVYGSIIFGLFYAPILIFAQATQTESVLAAKLALQVFFPYIIAGLFICIFDLDTLECCLRGYKKSSYYLATKLGIKEISRDEGLIGEFKGYVLSRTLKVPHKILHNVCIPMRNGNFQEIDTIIITRNIIYVVECKNRVGKFVGKFEDKEWVQYLGNQEKVVENIYLQNQQHTMALDQFLLDRGIIQNGQNVCMNVVLTTGKMKLAADNVPLDFVMGNARKVRKYIESMDKVFDDGTDTSGIMNQIYKALLPYALYTNIERSMMMEERNVRSFTKEFAKGEFCTQWVLTGISGVTNPGEKAEVRSNNLYTQVKIQNGKASCWQTRTDIGKQIRLNPNQISKGVDRERVESFKRALGDDPKLVLKKVVWIVFGVCLVILICAASMS